MTRYLPQTVLAIVTGIVLVLAASKLGHCSAHAQPAPIAFMDAAATGSGSAVVPAAPAASDPLAHPGDTLGIFAQLYHNGSWVPLIVFGAFCLLFLLVKEDSWFREGKRAAYFAAALGFLGILAVPASQGTTPNAQMIGMALATGIGLLLPNVLPKKASS